MRNINHTSKRAVFSIFATLVLWTIGAQPAVSSPDPDNAALLYYQAFLLRPQPDDATYRLLDAVLRGAEPDENLREYLNLKNVVKLLGLLRRRLRFRSAVGE